MQPSYPTYDEESNPGVDAFLLPCFFWGKDEQRDDGAQRRGKAENNGETERISNSLAYGIYRQPGKGELRAVCAKSVGGKNVGGKSVPYHIVLACDHSKELTATNR